MSRAGQAAGKKARKGAAAALRVPPVFSDVMLEELPPGIRARFTEIFVDEAVLSRCRSSVAQLSLDEGIHFPMLFCPSSVRTLCLPSKTCKRQVV